MEEADDLDKRVQTSGGFLQTPADQEINVVLLDISLKFRDRVFQLVVH